MKLGIIMKYKKKDEKMNLEISYSKPILDAFVGEGNELYVLCWKDIIFNGCPEVKKGYFYNNSEWIKEKRLPKLIDLLFLKQPKDPIENKVKYSSLLKKLKQSNMLCINDLKTIDDNLNKDYLLFLNKRGIPSIKTEIVPSLDYLLKRKKEKIVIKPLCGEKGKGVRRLDEMTEEEIKKVYKNHRLIAQPFESDIYLGERSLVFFGKELAMAVIKYPKKSFLSNECNGGEFEVHNPSKVDIELAKSALSIWPTKVNVSRIDIIGNCHPKISEVELVNPAYNDEYLKVNERDIFLKKLCNYVQNVYKENKVLIPLQTQLN